MSSLTKKKHDIRKFRDGIRSDSEKHDMRKFRDGVRSDSEKQGIEEKQKIIVLLLSEN